MRAVIALVGWGLCAVGCTAGGWEGDSGSELWCDGACRMFRRCGDLRTQAECRNECSARNPEFDRVSLDGADRLGDCIAKLECDVMFDDERWSSVQSACWDEARAQARVTGPVREFCAAYSELLYECDWWLSTAECERIYSMWSQEVLDDIAQCSVQTSCEAMVDCPSIVLDAP